MNAKELQKKWYAKLRATGFIDIESGKASPTLLLPSRPKRGRSVIADEAKADFYRLASWFLHDYAWARPRERRMWEMFVEGRPYREIAKITRVSFYQAQKTLAALIAGPFADYRAGLGLIEGREGSG